MFRKIGLWSEADKSGMAAVAQVQKASSADDSETPANQVDEPNVKSGARALVQEHRFLLSRTRARLDRDRCHGCRHGIEPVVPVAGPAMSRKSISEVPG